MPKAPILKPLTLDDSVKGNVVSGGPLAIAKSAVQKFVAPIDPEPIPYVPLKKIAVVTDVPVMVAEPEPQKIILPVIVPETKVGIPFMPDIGPSKPNETGGIAGGSFSGYTKTGEQILPGDLGVTEKKSDMSFLSKAVDFLVSNQDGVKASKDIAKVLDQGTGGKSNAVAATNQVVDSGSATIKKIVGSAAKLLKPFVPAGPLAAGFDKLTAMPAGTAPAVIPPAAGPLASASVDLGGKAGPVSIVYGDEPPKSDGKVQAWLWPVVIIVGIVVLFGKKLFR
jgi:hypothetical protein